MAVTKRTRFEVLRRDGFRCVYCGLVAAETGTGLTIDHVVPVALGGDDKPGNLVAACRDCNSGKASIQPDSPLVEGLSAAAAAYALGMLDKMTKFRQDLESIDDYDDEFLSVWNRWRTNDDEPLPLPHNYKMSLFRWMQMGVPASVFELVIPTAGAKFNRERYMKREDVFKYMAGIVWRMLDAREIDTTVTADSVAVYTAREADDFAFNQWSEGFRLGKSRATRDASLTDPLRNHIDGSRAEYSDEGGLSSLTGRLIFDGP